MPIKSESDNEQIKNDCTTHGNDTHMGAHCAIYCALFCLLVELIRNNEKVTTYLIGICVLFIIVANGFRGGLLI